MATSKKDVTVYIGRFSPFHRGHAEVLKRAMLTSKLVIVLVGSTGQARNLKNPFTYEERVRVITATAFDFVVAGIVEHGNPSSVLGELVILPLPDQPYNDGLWIRSVQEKVKHAIDAFAVKTGQLLTDVYLTGSDRDESTWYLSAFPQYKQDLVDEHRNTNVLLSATSVREVLFSGAASVTDGVKLGVKVPDSTRNFLLEFMKTPECKLLQQERAHLDAYKKSWSSAPYPPTFVTTDAIVVQSGHVLVVERGAFPGKGLWALPGGFLNQNERLADGCIRELIEETGIKVPEALLRAAVKTAPKEIFDNPGRSLRGRTITTAFLIRLDDTKPLPKVKGQNAPLSETGNEAVVETAKAFWLPLSTALDKTDMWFEDHHALLSWAVSQLNSR